MQACPANSNFSMGTLTHWSAYTGNNKYRGTNTSGDGNLGSGYTTPYDTTSGLPTGTLGTSDILEYQLGSPNGIQVITTTGTDPFGFFQTIPTINGYHYGESVKLGSTTISTGSSGSQGGYVRGIRYTFAVPTSPSAQPYTMTYAYAMVLENGTNNSNEQPLFSATLATNDSIITCASPQYYLPTFNNTSNQGTGATLDTAAAEANGFSISRQPSPNPNPNSPNGGHLLDVWTKGWTEVTFDLSPYRGQTVSLTFEADNCVPGGHFAYAYVALRNTCAGLIITGDTVACTNTDLTYSVPTLAGATYQWEVPSGWNIISGSATNMIEVDPGASAGMISAHEVNSCANLHDTIDVKTVLPTIPGFVTGDTTVCAGINSKILSLTGNRGQVVDWLSSVDGVNWTVLNDSTPSYTAQNLGTTMTYRALVQNGQSCAVDSSSGATVVVDPQSVGGTLGPLSTEICTGQNKGALLTLTGAVGRAENWQSAMDTTNWNNFVPADTTYTYSISGITVPNQYRVIVKSGVCPPDTSTVAFVNILPELFPQANIDPADTTLCYGATTPLNAVISIGTSYTWTAGHNTLTGPAGGAINVTPFDLSAVASPLDTTGYILNIINAGCPNPLIDTFQVNVHPKIVVNAGNDTAVVVNQPLQLNATSSDSPDTFTWTPAIGLNNNNIYDPIAILSADQDSIRYNVIAMAADGCFGSASILVKVFTTQPDIFVPSGFTPTVNINNIFRPILVGITSLDFFRVYNRFGQLVYSTSSTEDGWDGRINGKLQEPDAFVWMVQGRSYLGKTIFKKGTVVLIR